MPLVKQLRPSLVPVLHDLHGRAGVERCLGQMVVVEPSVAQKSLLQILAADEVVAPEHLFDPAVEAFHHAVGLGPAWGREPMLDARPSARLV